MEPVATVPFGLVIEAFTVNNERSAGGIVWLISTEQVRVTSDPLRTMVPRLLVRVTDCGSGTNGLMNR